VQILIAAVGKAKPGPERDLFDAYVARLPWRVDLKEIEIRKESAVAKRRAKEAEALLKAVPQGARIICLDETGIALASEKFAARVKGWRDGGARHLAFLIGGADGHDESVRKAADLVLSLGPMTWPHMLVRAMLAEQLYRAHAILSGHPYHRA
jgi:23S rRNA (pseudouridine1915-N3)-methyltransferase